MPLPQKIRTTFSSKLQIIMCLFSCNFPRARRVDPRPCRRGGDDTCVRGASIIFSVLCVVCIANFSAELIPAEMPLRPVLYAHCDECLLPPPQWHAEQKQFFSVFQTIECSLLIINQSSEQLASGDHVTTEQCHAVSRVTRDTWPVSSVTPTQCLYCAQIFTLLHKDTIYQLLAGLGWAG